MRFVVAFNGTDVEVAHEGDPPELFQPDIPVVLEGRWEGEVFSSDRIMIRHSSEYEAENQDRLREADEAGVRELPDLGVDARPAWPGNAGTA